MLKCFCIIFFVTFAIKFSIIFSATLEKLDRPKHSTKCSIKIKSKQVIVFFSIAADPAETAVH